MHPATSTFTPVAELFPLGKVRQDAPASRSGIELSESVQSLVRDLALIEPVEKAIGLARSVFPSASGFAFELECDPEEGTQWVVLRVTMHGTPREVLSARKAYSAKCVALVPWPQRHLVRLSYQIA